MEKYFAVVIREESSQQVFYVGEETKGAAMKTLLDKFPSLKGNKAEFFVQNGSSGSSCPVSKGDAVEWLVGEKVTLKTLSGPIIE